MRKTFFHLKSGFTKFSSLSSEPEGSHWAQEQVGVSCVPGWAPWASDSSIAPQGENKMSEMQQGEGSGHKGLQSLAYTVGVGSHLERRCLTSFALGPKEGQLPTQSLSPNRQKNTLWGDPSIGLDLRVTTTNWWGMSPVAKIFPTVSSREWIRLPSERQRIWPWDNDSERMMGRIFPLQESKDVQRWRKRVRALQSLKGELCGEGRVQKQVCHWSLVSQRP